jgi:hypothetical protein
VHEHKLEGELGTFVPDSLKAEELRKMAEPKDKKERKSG